MTTQLSREWLLERINSPEQFTNSEEAIEAFKLALAGMDSEPVAVIDKEGNPMTRAECNDDRVFAICCKVGTPLYAAPPAPVAVPDEVLARLEHEANHLTAWHHIDEHSCKVYRRDLLTLVNACRAAMQAGPVTAATVPDGWTFEACENEPCKNGAVVNVHGADIHLCADCSTDKKYSRMKLTALTKRISLPLPAAPEQEV